MKYLKGGDNSSQINGGDAQLQQLAPKLDLKNVISILISSDFLGMARLVNECITFVKININDVVRLPIDMNCLNAKLIKLISD